MKERLWELEILRAVACIAVIMIHTTAEVIFDGIAGRPMLLSLAFLNVSSKFAVPAFIFLSGFSLYYNHRDEKINYPRFLWKRLRHVLSPYLCWTLIYYAAFIAVGYYTFSAGFLLDSILLGDMSYHLYFIPIIVQFYLLFGVFRFCFNRYNSHVLLLLAAAANIAFLRYFSFIYIDRFFMRYIVFFALGMYFVKNCDWLKAKASRLSAFLSGGCYLALGMLSTYRFYDNFIIGTHYDNFRENVLWVIYSLISILFFSQLIWLVQGYFKGRLHKITAAVSDSSFDIYLAHPLVIYACQYLLGFFPIRSTAVRFIFILGAIAVLVFPGAIYYRRFMTKIRKKEAAKIAATP